MYCGFSADSCVVTSCSYQQPSQFGTRTFLGLLHTWSAWPHFHPAWRVHCALPENSSRAISGDNVLLGCVHAGLCLARVPSRCDSKRSSCLRNGKLQCLTSLSSSAPWESTRLAAFVHRRSFRWKLGLVSPPEDRGWSRRPYVRAVDRVAVRLTG